MVSKGTVILVPGFLGSALLTAPEDTPWYTGPVLWVDVARLGSGGWRYLQLAADGRSNAVPGAQPLVAGGLGIPYWGSMRTYLSDLGWNTWGVPQDWRGTTADDAGRLVATIQALASAAPLHLIAHSRGGLVVRQALANLRALGQLGLVGRVVGLGVPHTGAMEAVSVLAGWQQNQLGMQLIVDRISSYWWPYWRSGGWSAVTASWPALYALLPAPQAAWITPGQAQTIYSPASWSAISRIISPAWLTAAQIGWAALPPPDVAVPWLDVYGAGGTSTLVSFDGPGLPPDRDAGVWGGGDLVVPTASATWPGHPTYETSGTHASMATSSIVARVCSDWFQGITPAG